MRKNTHFYITIIAIWLFSARMAAQVVGNTEEPYTVHSAMTADQEDYDSLGCDTLVFLPTANSNDSVFSASTLSRRIDRLLEHPMFETSQVGLMIYDLTADSTLYTRGHRQLLRPASTMKLITAIATIDRLGGSYQFRTSLYYTGKIDSGTLAGDVYCVGGFDPRFNADDMKAFVDGIKSMGVDTIRGRILADRTM